MKRYNQIFAEMWGVYSLLWDIVSLPSSVCHKALGRQCRHVNKNVIHLVAVLLVMLSTPATGSQENKVLNRGEMHGSWEREISKLIVQQISTLNYYSTHSLCCRLQCLLSADVWLLIIHIFLEDCLLPIWRRVAIQKQHGCGKRQCLSAIWFVHHPNWKDLSHQVMDVHVHH